MLKDLKHQFNWKRGTAALLRRIQALAKNQTLSVRQYKVLRKVRTKERVLKTKLDLGKIADLFPGKTMSTLKSALEDLENKKIF